MDERNICATNTHELLASGMPFNLYDTSQFQFTNLCHHDFRD